MANAAPDGPISTELAAALCDRFLTYSVGALVTLLVCMLYVMSSKPPLPSCLVGLALALIVPLIPALRVQPRARAAEQPVLVAR